MNTEDRFLAEWEAQFTAYIRQHGDKKDGSHDLGHFQRVWKTARFINREEGGKADELILIAAAYFHDWVALPKDHPQRRESSRLSAVAAGELLTDVFAGFPATKVEGVQHAIHAHSFSAGVEATTLEAKILQDADRMEALGAIGAARTFYIAGQMNAQLFHAGDPMAEARELDDKRFALDHFEAKLLKLPAMMNTATGRRLAEKNAEWLRMFVRKMREEIEGEYV
ncbi:HD domain-containing protein [Puia dinghuensis]|uniref:Phosphohydrolase n=1 Tax=Puia dinghuensis TaxID=1792502 RepID=A0A8J2UH62_9BACT|nr:HD domain-containing protein [Puia dinghuensis]GGB14878.1 phosphohydrolase [Puia dinghuensis]